MQASIMKEFAKTFYHSKQWQKCRSSYIKERISIDGGMCELCHSDPGYIVHHKITLTPENIYDPEIALNHEHLQYVCHNCHNKIDHFGNKIEKYFNQCGFDAEGQPFILGSPPSEKF